MDNLFDTQLANALLDGEYSIGYQGLVKEKLEIDLNKQETRSNWMRRPLSDSQLTYAAMDVEYLIYLFLEQEKELVKANKIHWHNEEVNSLTSLTFDPINEDDVIQSKLNKTEENNLLFKFNEIVISIAKKEAVNPTLLFSKKSQKEFLRRVLNHGFKDASKFITNWRKDLIKVPLEKLILEL